MRLLMITAGAGGMYCGSCLRDNALAAELLRRGHDVLLLPVYTPTLTDEPNLSAPRVLFGGISVYLQQHLALFRHTPALLDRLWDAAPVIRAATGRGLSVDPDQLGALTVSTLRGEEGHQAKEFRKLSRHLRRLPPFDLAVLPNSLLISMAQTLERALGCPVVCTLQGEDLFLQGLREPYQTQAKALIGQHAERVSAFVATGEWYAGFMAGYLGLPRERVNSVPLGINLDGHGADAPPRTGPPVVGYLARVAPEKGLKLLAEAYRIARRELGLGEARLQAAGYLPPEQRGYLAELEQGLGKAGLDGEFRYHGTLDRAAKIAFLQGLDVFSVPSPYPEPKGIYALEALANGVPCVLPRHGAFEEVLGRTGGGRLVEPNEPRHLAEAILALCRDREASRAVGRQGADGVRQHHSVARMADRTLEVYTAVIEAAGLR